MELKVVLHSRQLACNRNDKSLLNGTMKNPFEKMRFQVFFMALSRADFNTNPKIICQSESIKNYLLSYPTPHGF